MYVCMFMFTVTMFACACAYIEAFCHHSCHVHDDDRFTRQRLPSPLIAGACSAVPLLWWRARPAKLASFDCLLHIIHLVAGFSKLFENVRCKVFSSCSLFGAQNAMHMLVCCMQVNAFVRTLLTIKTCTIRHWLLLRLDSEAENQESVGFQGQHLDLDFAAEISALRLNEFLAWSARVLCLGSFFTQLAILLIGLHTRIEGDICFCFLCVA